MKVHARQTDSQCSSGGGSRGSWWDFASHPCLIQLLHQLADHLCRPLHLLFSGLCWFKLVFFSFMGGGSSSCSGVVFGFVPLLQCLFKSSGLPSLFSAGRILINVGQSVIFGGKLLAGLLALLLLLPFGLFGRRFVLLGFGRELSFLGLWVGGGSGLARRGSFIF